MKKLTRGQKRRKHVENRARRKPTRERAKKLAKKLLKKNLHTAAVLDTLRTATRHLSPFYRPWRDMFGTRR